MKADSAELMMSATFLDFALLILAMIFKMSILIYIGTAILLLSALYVYYDTKRSYHEFKEKIRQIDRRQP